MPTIDKTDPETIVDDPIEELEGDAQPSSLEKCPTCSPSLSDDIPGQKPAYSGTSLPQVTRWSDFDKAAPETIHEQLFEETENEAERQASVGMCHTARTSPASSAEIDVQPLGSSDATKCPQSAPQEGYNQPRSPSQGQCYDSPPVKDNVDLEESARSNITTLQVPRSTVFDRTDPEAIYEDLFEQTEEVVALGEESSASCLASVSTASVPQKLSQSPPPMGLAGPLSAPFYAAQGQSSATPQQHRVGSPPLNRLLPEEPAHNGTSDPHASRPPDIDRTDPEYQEPGLAEDEEQDEVEDERRYGFSRYLTMGNPVVGGRAVQPLNPSAACVLRYISHRVKNSRNIVEGAKWYYGTTKEIAEKYPWFSSSGIAGIAVELEECGAVRRANFNRMPGDRTTWYSVPEAWLEAAETDLVYFRVADARQHGLIEAVVLENLRYWLNEHRALAGGGRQPSLQGSSHRGHVMLPATLAEKLPFSRSAITRALEKLVKVGRVGMRRLSAKRCSEYWIIGEETTQEASSPTVSEQQNALWIEDAFVFHERLENRFKGFCHDHPDQELQVALVRLAVNRAYGILITLEPDFIDQVRMFRRPEQLYSVLSDKINCSFPLDNWDPEMRVMRDYIIEAAIVLIERTERTWPAVCINQWRCIEIYQYRGDIRIAANVRHTAKQKKHFDDQHTAFWCRVREENPNLTAPEKQRFLAREIKELKGIGRWSYLLDTDGKKLPSNIAWDKDALRNAGAFFARNPGWHPWMLLRLLERCDEERMPALEGDHDPFWHVRRGVSLGFFVKNIDKIISQLGHCDEFPAIADDSDDEKPADPS